MKIRHPIEEDNHVYIKSKNDLLKSSIVRERSISMILGCEGDPEQKHVWTDDNDDLCKKCKRHYKDLAEEDDAYLRFGILNKDLFVSMKTILVVKCPELWAAQESHEGDPCIHCGWPEIYNQRYIDKYAYIFYDTLDVKNIKPVSRSPRVHKLSEMSLTTTQLQQQQSFSVIINRFPTEDHLSHLVALIKQMFHMNLQKFGMSEVAVSRLFNLHDVNKILFDHKPPSSLLSSVVGLFTKTHEKGSKMINMGLESGEDQDIHLQEDDISTLTLTSPDLESQIPDNEDETDALANNLSDADDGDLDIND